MYIISSSVWTDLIWDALRSLLSSFFIAVVVDVVIELGREGVSNWLLKADNLILIGETIQVLRL